MHGRMTRNLSSDFKKLQDKKADGKEFPENFLSHCSTDWNKCVLCTWIWSLVIVTQGAMQLHTVCRTGWGRSTGWDGLGESFQSSYTPQTCAMLQVVWKWLGLLVNITRKIFKWLYPLTNSKSFAWPYSQWVFLPSTPILVCIMS